jgi:multiple sugar transport system substrate-binding protein
MFNTRASSFGEIVAVSVLNTSDNKDVAEEWIKFLMTGDNYVYYLHMAPGGMNPTRSSIAESDEFLDNPILSKYDKEQITGIVAALDEVERFEFLDGQIIDEMSQLSANFVIGKAINYMFANDWTPQETAQWAQKEAERILGK